MHNDAEPASIWSLKENDICLGKKFGKQPRLVNLKKKTNHFLRLKLRLKQPFFLQRLHVHMHALSN